MAEYLPVASAVIFSGEPKKLWPFTIGVKAAPHPQLATQPDTSLVRQIILDLSRFSGPNFTFFVSDTKEILTTAQKHIIAMPELNFIEEPKFHSLTHSISMLSQIVVHRYRADIPIIIVQTPYYVATNKRNNFIDSITVALSAVLSGEMAVAVTTQSNESNTLYRLSIGDKVLETEGKNTSVYSAEAEPIENETTEQKTAGYTGIMVLNSAKVIEVVRQKAAVWVEQLQAIEWGNPKAIQELYSEKMPIAEVDFWNSLELKAVVGDFDFYKLETMNDLNLLTSPMGE